MVFFLLLIIGVLFVNT